MVDKTCPNCGAVTLFDGDFCSECGERLSSESSGFFNKLDEKISLSSLIFSFIVLGIFLFIGSLFFGIFVSNGTIGFLTHIMLTVLLAVFVGAVFLGYANCSDNTYIVPNFAAYLGTIVATVLCGVGILFALISAFASTALNSLFSSSPTTSSYGGASSYSSASGGTDTNMLSLLASKFIVDILILVLLIPAASYLGIYLGYLIKNNLN